MSIRNRITDFGLKPADQFQANPQNWRTHPQHQREAVRASLNELGWVGVVIENATTGHLVDGHERVWQALQDDNADVPYVTVELTENEEKLALATLDPITNMATTDAAILDDLLQDVNTGEAALQSMLSDLATDAGIAPPDFAPVSMGGQSALDELAPKLVVCPGCGHEFDSRLV